MTRYQRARRYAFWRGFAIALAVFVGLIYLGALAGKITGYWSAPLTNPINAQARRGLRAWSKP